MKTKTHNIRNKKGQYKRNLAKFYLFLTILLALGGYILVARIHDYTLALQDKVTELQAKQIELIKEYDDMDSITMYSMNNVLNPERYDMNKIPYLSAAEREIIRRESSFRTTAKNPKSTAFGLCQMLDYNRVKYAKLAGVSNPNSTSQTDQIKMCKKYIERRYQDADTALEFHNQHNWF